MLPKINLPMYEMKLSDGKSITYRPFTVAEERIILMATQSKDPHEMKMATIQVVQNCVTGNVDMRDVPFYDFNRLVAQLKARSVGETDQSYTCKHEVDGQSCNASFTVKIKLDEIKITNLNHPKGKVFQVQPGVSLEVKYPTFENVWDSEMLDDDWLIALSYLKNNVVAIYNGDNRLSRKDINSEELKQWIETLPKEVMDEIYEFYTDLPYMMIKTNTKCPKCGFEHNIEHTRFNASFF